MQLSIERKWVRRLILDKKKSQEEGTGMKDRYSTQYWPTHIREYFAKSKIEKFRMNCFLRWWFLWHGYWTKSVTSLNRMLNDLVAIHFCVEYKLTQLFLCSDSPKCKLPDILTLLFFSPRLLTWILKNIWLEMLLYFLDANWGILI